MAASSVINYCCDAQSLDQPIQRALESRLDADFSNVRIHTGGKAAEAADAIDAKAFTCGNDIVFNFYRERGYQTLEPDRIAGSLIAIATLSDDEFEQLFGEYCQQHAHHFQRYVEPPIEPPVDSEAGGFLRYELDIYLRLADHLEGSLSAFLTDDLHDVTDGLMKTLEDEHAEFDPEADLEIDTVSDLRVAYQDGPDEETVIGDSNPIERPPDTTLQLVPQPFLSPDASRALLIHYLACQIRDCYIEMGAEPPAAYRLLGHGFYESAQRYRLLERYDDYHDFDAEIPGYGTIDLGHDPEAAEQST